MSVKRRHSVGWLGMCLLSPIMAWAGPDAMTSKDGHFLMTAAETQKTEIAFGQMATQRAESEKVKQLAQRMVDDHTKAGQEVRTLAEAAGVTLPTKRRRATRSEATPTRTCQVKSLIAPTSPMK